MTLHEPPELVWIELLWSNALPTALGLQNKTVQQPLADPEANYIKAIALFWDDKQRI